MKRLRTLAKLAKEWKIEDEEGENILSFLVRESEELRC